MLGPLSGHFSTLLRGTVRTLLPEQDVWISDWHNARDVGLDHGSFGFDTYVEYVIRWLELLGPDTHVIAVCQPCVAALAATAVMAEAGNPCQPRTLTLMAGPIDTRVDPTVVNDLATSRPLSWFERNVIATVPGRYAGRRPPGVPRLPAAQLVREHEPRATPRARTATSTSTSSTATRSRRRW